MGVRLQQSRKVHEALLCLAHRWMLLWPVQNSCTLQFFTLLLFFAHALSLLSFPSVCYCLVQFHNSVQQQCMLHLQRIEMMQGEQWCSFPTYNRFAGVLSLLLPTPVGELHCRPPDGVPGTQYQGTRCTCRGTLCSRCSSVPTSTLSFWNTVNGRLNRSKILGTEQ